MSTNTAIRVAVLQTALADLLRNFEEANRGIPYDAMVLEGARALLEGGEAEIEQVMLDTVLVAIDNAALTDAVTAEAGRQGPQRLARAIVDTLHDAGPNLARRRHYGS